MKELIFCVLLIAAGALAQTNLSASEAKIKYPYVEFAPCPCLCYTRWFDRDDPSGFGDFETLLNLRLEYPGQICDHPFGIEAQTLSGINAAATGQVFAYYDTVHGFACVNSQQRKGRRCLDYKVRFICPCKYCKYLKEDLPALDTVLSRDNGTEPVT